MGSVLLLLFIGFILAILVWIVIIVPRWAKPLIIIGAFLAVTADGYLGRKKLEQLCKEQGGLHIYQTVEGVEGFEGRWLDESPWLTEYGYKYIEKQSTSLGEYERLERLKDGTIRKMQVSTPKSEYKYYFYSNSDVDNFDDNYYVSSLRIERKTDRKILADYTRIGYRGGWAERLINSIYASKASVARCDSDYGFNHKYWEDNFVKVLKPIEMEK